MNTSNGDGGGLMEDQVATRPEAMTEPLIMTLAAPGDERQIEAVLLDIQRWLRQTGSDQWQRPFPLEWIAGAIARGEFWIAWDQGRLAGVIRLLNADPLFWGDRDDGSALYVHTLAVSRALAGQGRGRAILAWAATEALARGRSRLRLDCAAANTALCAYYAQAGFVQCGPAVVGGEAMMLFEQTVSS